MPAIDSKSSLEVCGSVRFDPKQSTGDSEGWMWRLAGQATRKLVDLHVKVFGGGPQLFSRLEDYVSISPTMPGSYTDFATEFRHDRLKRKVVARWREYMLKKRVEQKKAAYEQMLGDYKAKVAKGQRKRKRGYGFDDDLDDVTPMGILKYEGMATALRKNNHVKFASTCEVRMYLPEDEDDVSLIEVTGPEKGAQLHQFWEDYYESPRQLALKRRVRVA